MFYFCRFILVLGLVLGCCFSQSVMAFGPTLSNPLPSQQHFLGKFYFESGLIKAKNGQLSGALSDLHNAYTLSPQRLDVIVAYADALSFNRQFDEANTLYETLYRQTTDAELQADIRFEQAVIAHRAQRQQAEYDYLTQAIEQTQLPKKKARYYFERGAIHANADSVKAFQAVINDSYQSLTYDPTFAPAWNNYGYSLLQLGQVDKGLKAIQKSYQLDPKSANTLDSLAYAYFLKKQYPQAIQMYRKALALNSELAESWYYLGKSYELTNRPREARNAYKNAMLSQPNANLYAQSEKALILLNRAADSK